MVYDRPNDQLHIGPEGSVHNDLLRKLNLRSGYSGQRHDYDYPNGWIGVNPEYGDEGSDTKGRIFGIPYGWYDHAPGEDVNRAAVNYHRFWLKNSVDPNKAQGMGHALQIMNPQTRDPDRAINWDDYDSGRTIEPRTYDSYNEDEGPPTGHEWNETYETYLPEKPGSDYTWDGRNYKWEQREPETNRSDLTMDGYGGWITRDAPRTNQQRPPDNSQWKWDSVRGIWVQPTVPPSQPPEQQHLFSNWNWPALAA